MESLLNLITLTILAMGAPVMPGEMRNSVALSWDYDTNNAPDVFKLYSSGDISSPLTNWPLVATVSGNVHDISIGNLVPQQAWFYVTASNWWGESLPSNLAGIPQPPSGVGNLRIK